MNTDYDDELYDINWFEIIRDRAFWFLNDWNKNYELLNSVVYNRQISTLKGENVIGEKLHRGTFLRPILYKMIWVFKRMRVKKHKKVIFTYKKIVLSRGGHVKNVHTRMRDGVGGLSVKKHNFYSMLHTIFYVFFMQYHHVNVLFYHFWTLLETNLQASSQKTLKK